LLLAAGPVAAEWVEVDATPDATFYIDPTTVTVDGQMRRVWIMVNRFEPFEGTRSVVALHEYDCGQELSRYLHVTGYAGPMATGDDNTHTEPTLWAFVSPGSPGEAMLKFVCYDGPALAEWEEFGGHETATMYFDPASIRVDGQMRRVWTLGDRVVESESGIKSLVMLDLYDCSEERSRYLQIIAYAEPMATGSVIETMSEPSPWQAVAPETLGAAMLEFVCSLPE